MPLQNSGPFLYILIGVWHVWLDTWLRRESTAKCRWYDNGYDKLLLYLINECFLETLVSDWRKFTWISLKYDDVSD